MVELQRELRPRHPEAHPAVRLPGPGKRWPGLPGHPGAEKVLQPSLPAHPRGLVPVGLVDLLHPGLSPVQAKEVLGPGAQERRAVLPGRRRRRHREAEVHRRDVQT